MPVSIATYKRLVLEDPEGRWEYWCGRPRRKPEMTAGHEHLGSRLASLIAQQIDIDRFDVRGQGAKLRTSTGNFFIPDVTIVPHGLLLQKLDERSTDVEVYSNPIAFVAEVWSPSTGEYDVDTKFPEYKWRGDKEIWRIHPVERAITVWRLQPDGSYSEVVVRGGSVTLVAVPNVTISLERLFQFLPGSA